MQALTQNPYTDERWSNVRVVFELVDVDAAENAAPTATSQAAISKLDQTHNRITGMSKKLASLEQDYFLLDGSYILPSETDNGEVGWWSSEISNSNKVLVIPQVLEFSFTADQSSIGFTIVFDDKANEYAEDLKIQIYNSAGALIKEDIVTGNDKNKYVSEMQVEGYRKVKITFTKTSLPWRRVRVCEVVFGIIQTFDKSNSTDVKLIYEISPNSENLPSNELSITIQNTDKKYNMINPKGIYNYLQQGQGLNIEVGVGSSRNNIEFVNMGRFYFTTSTAEDSGMTAQIVAHDQMYDLDRGLYRKGLNATDTVANIISDIIADSGQLIPISISSAVASRVIGKNLPIVSHREAIRMVAQAARAVCFINRSGTLVLIELAEALPVDTITNNSMYSPAKVAVAEYVNIVEVGSYDFKVGSSAEIYKGVNQINGTRTLWVEYSGPASNVTSAIVGGTINSAQYYLYGAKFTITAATEVTLTLNGTGLEIVQATYRAGNGQPELLKRIENPLVKGTFASVFASWILANTQKRLTYSIQERGNPAREICDTVKIYDAYNENRNAIMIKEEYAFDGTLKANTTARGGM